MSNPAPSIESLHIRDEFVAASAAAEAATSEQAQVTHDFVFSYLALSQDCAREIAKHDNQGPSRPTTFDKSILTKDTEKNDVIRNVIPDVSGNRTRLVIIDRDPETDEITSFDVLPLLKAEHVRYGNYSEAYSVLSYFMADKQESRDMLPSDAAYEEVLARAQEAAGKVSEFLEQSDSSQLSIDSAQAKAVVSKLLQEGTYGDLHRTTTIAAPDVLAANKISAELEKAKISALRDVASAVKAEANGDRIVEIAVEIPDTVPPMSVIATVQAVDLREPVEESPRKLYGYRGRHALVIMGNTAVVSSRTGQPPIFAPGSLNIARYPSIASYLANSLYTNATPQEITANNATFQGEDNPHNHVQVRQNPPTQYAAEVPETSTGWLVHQLENLSVDSLRELHGILRTGRQHWLEIQARKDAASEAQTSE